MGICSESATLLWQSTLARSLGPKAKGLCKTFSCYNDHFPLKATRNSYGAKCRHDGNSDRTSPSSALRLIW